MLRIWSRITFGTGIALLITAAILIITVQSDAEAAASTQNTWIDANIPEKSAVTTAVATTSAEASLSKKDAVTCAKESAEKNGEVIGWIRIEGTPVDYPVVQTQDDTYYLTHDIEKKESVQGAIFLDYRCDSVSLEGINIIYGHHMKDGSMFASLVQYKDESFFESHPIIEFATLKKTYKWEIFAVLITDTHYNYLQTEFINGNRYLDFIKTMQGKSIFKTDISLSKSDDVLILSTCTYEYKDARFVVAARRTQ